MRNVGVFLLSGGLIAAVSLGIAWGAGLLDSGSSQTVTNLGATPGVLTASSPPAGTASATPSATPAAPAGTPITRPFDLPILMYHHVSQTVPGDALTAGLTVTTTGFEQELQYLKCAGYTAVTMAQLFAAMDGKAVLPRKPVMLTFDDGYDDGYTQAFPLLQKYGFAGSFAIITGLVEGGGPYMSWAQIREMADAGMEMTSHTVTHIDLGTSDDATDRDQLATSKQALQSQTGRPVEFLVYPSGEPFRSGSEARQAEVVALLREAGYRGALLDGSNTTTQDPSAPFALNRWRVFGSEDIYTYAGSIGGPSPDSVAC